MKKTTSSILIGLACTTILSLSTGVQSAKADNQASPQISQQLNNRVFEQFVTYDNNGKFFDFKADNVVNGYVTDKTTRLSFKNNIPNTTVFYILDNNSGKIIQSLTSAEDNVYVSGLLKAGHTYSVVYQPASGTTEFQFSFKVTESIHIENPTINKVTNQDTSVSGTGIPGATVHIIIAGDTYTGVVDASGNYNISLNKAYPTNSAISLYQEKDGVKSDSVTATVVDAPDHLEIPKIDTVTDQDTTVSGTAAPGATVHLTVNGLSFSAVASDSGHFSINIEKKYPANTPISVYQELNGMRSDTIEVYVQLTTDFIVNKVKSNATSITGSAHPNAEISIKIHDEDFSGIADGNGNFNINLHGATFEVGSEITVTSVSSEGTFTKTVQIYPRDPIIGLVFVADDEIRGTADPGATVTITVGSVKYQTTAGETGNFRQSVNPNLVVSGTLVTVSTSINGLESDLVTTTVNLNK